MGRNKRRMLALSMTALTVIAGTLAYFTSVDNVTNTFGSATLQIRVTEPHWRNDPTIVPEQKVDKDPYIVNTDKTPAYVFIQVTVPVQEVTLEKNSGDDKGIKLNTCSVPLFRFINSDDEYSADALGSEQLFNKGWHPMADYTRKNTDDSGKVTGITYLYAWTDNDDPAVDDMAVLYPGKTTDTPLFDKVIFCNAREDDALSGSSQFIDIKVFGIQTEYLKSSDETETKADKVWHYLNKEL